jgi:asparagine synthase (glutamine-hydrolysing)
MCGILGWLSDQLPDQKTFERMLSVLVNRGPDAQDIARPAPHVLLGHTRLAIMDTSNAGRQPMHDPKHGIWTVVNGEIYNYPQLRRELEKEGCVFKSRSDSEAVLHGYIVWGDAVVSHLSGIFAFAIYDQYKDRLLLARDAAGVKPLYYEPMARGIAFSSELKALVAVRNDAYNLEPSAMWAYLAHRYIPDELTPDQNVRTLLPAHLLVWEDGKTHVKRWWSPGSRPAKSSDDLCEILKESVSAQLMSDVPLGVLLSGGIDSSAVTAIASNTYGRLDAFCCGFDEEGYDERRYARATAEASNARLHETLMDKDALLSSLPAFIDWFDEPFFDYSAIGIYRLCEMARQRGIKVLMAGDGADELFAGYLWYDDFSKFDNSDENAILERFFRYNGQFTTTMLSRLAGKPVEYDHLEVLRRYYRPDLSKVNRAQWLDFHTFLPGDILTKVDRASMALGIEVRVPWLDQRLLNECFLWPEDVVYRSNERKHIFKKALSEILPEHILTARKKGFGFPLNAWIKSIRAVAKCVLTGGQLQKHGFASASGIEDALSRLNAHHIWTLLIAELWLRRFIAKENIESLLSPIIADSRFNG